MTIESGTVPSETRVLKTCSGNKYCKVAAAASNFMVDAGLRCDNALDSKTTSPVLTSISETDGLLNSGSTASLEKTLAAEMGSKADALGAKTITAAVSRADLFNRLRIALINFSDYATVAMRILRTVRTMSVSQVFFFNSLFLAFT